ncbi:MAG: hypothetical protein ACTSYD_13780 [Candidatus Heimdallarchaeaceae archaeon]
MNEQQKRSHSLFFCFFCEEKLDKIPEEYIVTLPCCGIICHKKELFQWFLKHAKCPNCKATVPTFQEQILAWGENRKKKRVKHPTLKKHQFNKFNANVRKARKREIKEKQKTEEK